MYNNYNLSCFYNNYKISYLTQRKHIWSLTQASNNIPQVELPDPLASKQDFVLVPEPGLWHLPFDPPILEELEGRNNAL